MPTLNNIKKMLDRSTVDVCGVSASSAGVTMVRVKKAGGNYTLAAAERFSEYRMHNASKGDDSLEKKALNFPGRLKARYAALCCDVERGCMKILRVPDSFDMENRTDVMSRLALDESLPVRLAHRVIMPGGSKSDARILVSAMLEDRISSLMSLLPQAGMPAARLVQSSELAVINAFHHDPRLADEEDPYCVIHFDYDFCVVAMFNEGNLSQFKTFHHGVAVVLRKIAAALNVDESTAMGVLIDGAFDISHMIEDSLRDMRSHVVVSRDFMERSENCVMSKIFCSGPDSLTRPFLADLPGGDQSSSWSVLDMCEQGADEDLQMELRSEPWQLAAPFGAAIGLLLPA